MPAHLGDFEYAVLLAVLQLKEDAYAVPLRSLIEERTERTIARGALYTALERLEGKGCLRSVMKNPSDERGGRPRRIFDVTPKGVEALRGTHGALQRLSTGLEAILERP